MCALECDNQGPGDHAEGCMLGSCRYDFRDRDVHEVFEDPTSASLQMNQEVLTTQPDRLEHLTGLIERVTFHNGDTGFAVLQVKVQGLKDLVPVLGTLPEVSAGEWIDARGRWVMDREYGRQFRSVTLRTAPPNTTEGMTKYLASGLIKGIGPALAGRLVGSFGLQVFEVIEQTPQRLLEVEGIGAGRQGKIVAAWNDQKIVREIMVFLHSHGVSTSRAFRIYKTYDCTCSMHEGNSDYGGRRDFPKRATLASYRS